MPLDGHLYLVGQGWRGKGTGLRDGAIKTPLAIPQKKNLAGLGKDRDEAFPFWDHLFTAAAKSIQLKCPSDSDGESNTENTFCREDIIRRTTTGILSNRRPVEGTSATPNPSTPSANSDSSKPRVNLIAAAKRDAAKQILYSRFFRGPVLGPEDGDHGVIENVSIDLKVVIDVVKEGIAPKRKRGGGGEGVEQRKKKRQKKDGRQEGLNAIKSKGDNSKKKDEMTTSLSMAEVSTVNQRRTAEKKKKK